MKIHEQYKKGLMKRGTLSFLIVLLFCARLFAQSITENYIRTETVLIKDQKNGTNVDNLNYQQKQTRIGYFDGLGRPDQVNDCKASPYGDKDIITPVTYDSYGRQDKEYLPYAHAANGNIHESETSSMNWEDYYPNDASVAYAKKVFENSPLNRVMKQGAPGAAWQPSSDPAANNDHAVRFEYGTNDAGFPVKYFYVDASGSLQGGSSDYVTGRLFRTTTWDEDDRRTDEFQDKLGQIVMKAADRGGANEALTYYVYDDRGLLYYVLPPKALADGTVDAGELDMLCYQYRYDERNRMMEKKLPGAGRVYMVYDNRDRLVLSQTAEQQSNGYWMFTKYNALNLPVLTGKYYSSSTRSSLQSTLDVETVMYESSGSVVLNYTNNAFPIVSDESNYLSATYYDDYSVTSGWGYNYSTIYTDNPQATTVKGRITGAKTKVLGTSTWLYTVNYYDKYGQLIQSYQTNPEGGYNRLSTAYNFTGQPVKQQTYHLQNTSSAPVTLNEQFDYDHAGRPTYVRHGYNTTTLTIVAQYTYDEIGRMVKKELHNGYQDIDHSYNIRGWLTGLNDPTTAVSNDKLFAMQLYYNTDMTGILTGDAQYNGNINGIQWRLYDNTKKGYNFSYDGLNRLTAADYGTYSGNWATSNAYDMGISSYDLNGNINGLNRKNNMGTDRDNFSYTYSGNQLAWISGTMGGAYLYDSNGNLTNDGPRGLTVSYFDEINLPRQYYKNDTAKVDYTYDAQGTKWAKTATFGSTVSTMRYYGNFIYQDNTLDKVLTSEGYVDVQSGGIYHYYLKDHLGNTRMTISYDNAVVDVVQEAEYYPFGSLFADNNLDKNTYLYNGKELNNEFFENYDYGARMYDPQLGRFHTQDRFAEKYWDLTPYQYAANNPILYIDVNGDSINVAEAHREAFMNDLQKVYGDNAKSFSYNKSGNLVFNGKVGDLTEDQQAVFEGMNTLMSEETTTNVVYGESHTVGEGDKKETLNTADFGGALTRKGVDVNGQKQNFIVISPNISDVNVSLDGMMDILSNKQANVQQNTTSGLFHEIGEAITTDLSFRGGVIDYENKARKIIALPLRPYDLNHSKTIKTIYK
ncbi:MAG: hypothetical protein A2W90_21385 [Bacteroidetes bacterium GWF2_42_66]|nr:MAG: hypothetical protein A2W92_06490 [Bacteroidetes bacterium GWA2_42_15]OFX98887.1 MAG: hypothetical protein A2W89_13020 [Bacteroidetes bacterium GWE2_42_39]OFY45602.1 MAG: hypothetical protein A2W90_21385 [Bacteroidetes bacterium GWF2_42_66]HBL77418.1 hypothetical protein [Prolixibacteraceae bacterium]HCU62418.1 hypothetical protein [Prolixibacteraceae bacterium]